MVVAGCGGEPETAPLPFADPGESADVEGIWGEFACAERARIEAEPDGGADGGPYRRFTVLDGDEVDGERCEVGRNDRTDGPTVFYRDGERIVTRFAVRLPESYPLGEDRFQVVVQMKQTQPAANGSGTPALSLEARDGEWKLFQSASAGASGDTRELWEAPAEIGVWTTFEIDAAYSADPGEGSVRVRADLDEDGGLEEDSGEIATYTLKRETEGGEEGDGIEPGEPIPSHLRIGLYHDPKVPCPAPEGCSVEFDEVEVERSG